MTEEDIQELEYIKAGYSPRLFQPEDLTIESVVYDEQDDFKKLELARKQVLTTGQVRVSFDVSKVHHCLYYCYLVQALKTNLICYGS